MQSLNCKNLKITFLHTITHFIAIRTLFTSKFCINCSLQCVKTVLIYVKNAGIALQKVQLLKCKILKYKPLNMDADSAQNVDLKIQNMQSHCHD